MLTGSIPFEGQGVLELLYAHVHLDPVLPSSLKPELNESADAVVMRGLAKEPRSRWGSCEAFVTALAAALGAKAAPPVERTIAMAPLVERIDSPLPFAPPPATVPSPVWPPAAVIAARRRSRMRRYVIAAIAALALLALIVGDCIRWLGRHIQRELPGSDLSHAGAGNDPGLQHQRVRQQGSHRDGGLAARTPQSPRDRPGSPSAGSRAPSRPGPSAPPASACRCSCSPSRDSKRPPRARR